MSNKLFLVCPFSCMEPFLRSKYGNDIFFLTAPGAILSSQNYGDDEAIRDFIVREKIATVYIVNDSSCRFINGIIKNDKLFGLPAEKIIEDIYIDYYLSDFKNQSLANQQLKLAELTSRNQVNEIGNSILLGWHFS
ncbi:MAG: hypothetical protein ACI837_001182 [Crocinitomicaceae bacterium]|jgi:hypothetical protein